MDDPEEEIRRLRQRLAEVQRLHREAWLSGLSMGGGLGAHEQQTLREDEARSIEARLVELGAGPAGDGDRDPRIVRSTNSRREPRGGMASLPLLLGIPIGAVVGLGIGAAAGGPGIGAAIGVPAGLMIGLVWTVIWEQMRRRADT